MSSMAVKCGLVTIVFGLVMLTQTRGQSMRKDVLEVIKDTSDLNFLAAAVRVAGLEEDLEARGPFTLFAPNNKAFSKIPRATLEALLKSPDELTIILERHIVPDQPLLTRDLQSGPQLVLTKSGEFVTVTKSGSRSQILIEDSNDNDEALNEFDVEELAIDDPGRLITRIRNRENLRSSMPTRGQADKNDKSAVVNVTSRFSEASVESADIKAKNGVIHIIDNVL